MRLMRMFPVSMFLMRVSRFNCLLVRSENVDLGGSKPAAADLAHLQARTDIERGCCFLKTSKRNARINEGAEQHVAADAGKTL